MPASAAAPECPCRGSPPPRKPFHVFLAEYPHSQANVRDGSIYHVSIPAKTTPALRCSRGAGRTGRIGSRVVKEAPWCRRQFWRNGTTGIGLSRARKNNRLCGLIPANLLIYCGARPSMMLGDL